MSDDRLPDVGDRLVQSLLTAARAQARFAMEAHADPLDAQSKLKAAIASGVAVELALKAAVASILPSLLAEKGDAHSQLFLMGRGGMPGRSQSDVRTIMGMAAWQLYKGLRPQVGISDEDVKVALAVRNAVMPGSIDSSFRRALPVGSAASQSGVRTSRSPASR